MTQQQRLRGEATERSLAWDLPSLSQLPKNRERREVPGLLRPPGVPTPFLAESSEAELPQSPPRPYRLDVKITAMGINAQQPRKVTKKWFPNPDVRIETPAFSRSYGFTTYKQMMKYVNNEAASHPQQVTVKAVGKTQRGRDIPLVVVTDGKSDEGKLRVLYTGCVHGNEHAGTEGLLWFIHQLTSDSEIRGLLKGIDFYIRQDN